MPNARIITSRPQVAEPVADSLRESGYSVEITTPEHASFKPVDLEMNLDRCDSAPRVHQPGEQDVTFAQNGYAESEEQPRVIEREFVLAPLWRKWKAQFAQMFGRGEQQQVDEDAPVSMSFLGLDESQAAPPPAPRAPATVTPIRQERIEAKPVRHEGPVLQEPVKLEEAAPVIHERVHEPVEPIVEPEPVRMEEAAPILHEAAAPFVPELQAHPEPVVMQEAEPHEAEREVEEPPMTPISHEAVEVLPRNYEPEPAPFFNEVIETSGPDSFDAAAPTLEDTHPNLQPQWHEQFEPVQREVEQPEPVRESVPEPLPAIPQPVAATPKTEVRERKTPFLVAAAMRMEEMRGRAAAKFAEWRTRPRPDAKPARDYVWRQAIPVAAGLAVAFLIGWTAAMHTNESVKPAASTPAVTQQNSASNAAARSGYTVGPQAPVPNGGYTVGPQRQAAPRASAPAPRVATNKPVASQRTKPSPRRRSSRSSDYAAEDDVVVHHYNTKPKVPEVHRASLKKYSDID